MAFKKLTIFSPNKTMAFKKFLEKRSGVNSKLLSKYENGRIIPTANTLRKIAEGLDISADYLKVNRWNSLGNKDERYPFPVKKTYKRIFRRRHTERGTKLNLLKIDNSLFKADGHGLGAGDGI